MAANAEFQDLAASLSLTVSLEDLNETLDELLLEFFENLETLEGLRNDLTTAMRNGFLSMSKARYSMGNKAVGEMQYARKMTASTFVLERDSCPSEDDKEKIKLELSDCEVVFDGDKKKLMCKGVESLVENERPGLRERGVAKNHQEEIEGGGLELKSETEFSSRKESTDPLKWFGVLVPTSLKDCQKDFKIACRLSCEIAQLEQELDRIMDDYYNLKEKKILMKSLDEKKLKDE